MRYIHIANIAAGGHAGDEESVAVFRRLAREHEVRVCAHLSYPDREGFGRVSLDISPERLLQALSRQHDLMPDVRTVKFHGALYNESCRNGELAGSLAEWLAARGINSLLAPERSEMAHACEHEGIAVVAEGFCERRYHRDAGTGRLELVSRSRKYASIERIEEALAQARSLAVEGRVKAVIEGPGGTLEHSWVPIRAQTICIHSDSPLALQLARRLRGLPPR
jgi:UPF0271 protein